MNRLQPGQTLGTCKIEAFIAEGGMATVYRAQQTLMNLTVALKVLHPKFLENQKALAGFLKEGMAGARLTHPSIAQVFYTGEENGIYYIVMDFVDGKDLRTILREKGPLPPRKALEIARQVAEVLSFTHDRGVVHRDIKPGNIMIARSGEVILTDFGIASLLSERGKGKKRETSGTPAFMSPEQFRGEVVDGRTDLYSLGVTLFCLLTGSPPFRGSTARNLAEQVLQDRPPSLREVLPGIPRNVAMLVERLLSKDPADRYQTARDVIAVIDDCLSERAPFQGSVSPRISKEFLWRRSFWLPVLISVAAVWVFATCLFFAMSWAAPSFAGKEESSGEDGSSVDSSGTRQPVLGAPPISLEGRLELLGAAIVAGDMQRMIESVEPEQQNHAPLLSSLVSLFQVSKSFSSDVTSTHAILSRKPDRANVLLLIGDPNEHRVLQVPLTLIRDRNGAWYILPDSDGRIRFGIHLATEDR